MAKGRSQWPVTLVFRGHCQRFPGHQLQRMVSSIPLQPWSPFPKKPIKRLNHRATSYESMDVHKETMFSKTLCRTAVYSHLHLPRDAVTFFKNLIDGSSTADRQKVTYVILFYDDTGKGWEFTYCQWQKRDDYGHYFSKGWRNFLKARHLKENDTVTFWRGQTNQEQFFISYPRAGNINGAIQQPSGGDSGQPGQRHIDTDFDTILDQPYTDTMEQNPLANHPTPTAALLSSRTSDQGSPSPSAIAFADSLSGPENMEHSPSGSPFLNASGSVPNTAVTDHRPMPNSGQIISNSSLNICDMDFEFGTLEFLGLPPPPGTEIPARADGQYSIQNEETPTDDSQYHQLEEIYENLENLENLF